MNRLVTQFLLLVLLLVSSLPLMAQAKSRSSSHPVPGKLKIWVPAGIVGDNYWIYLNGHIVSTPPHAAEELKHAEVITVATGKLNADGTRESNDGWDVWNADGLVLRMRHEDWDRTINAYLNSGTGDTLHIFQAVELPLYPGEYTVEVAILSTGESNSGPHGTTSFPFVFTRKSSMNVQRGKTAQIYLAIPDRWSNAPAVIPAVPFRRVCPGAQAAPPDVNQLERLVKQYMNDPLVQVLRGADAAGVTPSKGVVVLDLPQEQGGPHEFDGSQIRHIADAIAASNDLPTQRDVDDCQNQFPQFSKSYAQYGKIISDINNDIESFRKLAAKLERAQ